MRSFSLRYGKGAIPFEFDEERFSVLETSAGRSALTDIEIGERLDSPIGSPLLEEIVSAGETVLFVVPDATRNAAAGQIVNLLVRRLIANGTMPHEMAVIFATGIHRPVTPAEQSEILTPFIAQRIKLLHHDAQNPIKLFNLGETSCGIPIELNWTLTEYDHVLLIGGVAFHYFAGFTGGRKLICPGLASARTIAGTHALAFDCGGLTRREGVGNGMLANNTVHEAFVEAASKIKISFAVNTIVGEGGEAVDVFCGDWIESHLAACERYAADNTISIPEKRGIVIASCGGFPHDINMIQAHKALEAASHACADGGTIILLAECSDGLGRGDFLDWFSANDSRELAERLCRNYQVNGQTAWSLLQKAERFDVRIFTSLDDRTAGRLRMTKLEDGKDMIAGLPKSGGFIISNGGRTRITS